jgi:protease II
MKKMILFCILTLIWTGHGGASGRFEALKELAKEFTFIDLESITK